MGLQKLASVFHEACGAYRSFVAGQKEMIGKGLTMVMLGSEYAVSPHLFDEAAVDFPMTERSWLSNVGRTSIDIYRILETADSDRKVLVSGVARYVCMDFVSGNSVPFPSSPERTYLSSALPPTVRCFPSIEVPESCADGSFLTTVKVRYDDMDHNWHSNHSSYTAYALECGARAAATGYYSRIRDDIAFYRALSWTCIYLGESFAGDDLQLSTWQDADNALLLHFLINRQQQKICYVMIELDENSIASKL